MKYLSMKKISVIDSVFHYLILLALPVSTKMQKKTAG